MNLKRLESSTAALVFIVSFLPCSLCQPFVIGGSINTPQEYLKKLLPSVYNMKLIDIITWSMSQEDKARDQEHTIKHSSQSNHKLSLQSDHQNDILEEDSATSEHNNTILNRKKHHRTPLRDSQISRLSNTCKFHNGLKTLVEKLNPHIDVTDTFMYSLEDIASLQTNKPEECFNRRATSKHFIERCYSAITQRDLGSEFFPRTAANREVCKDSQDDREECKDSQDDREECKDNQDDREECRDSQDDREECRDSQDDRYERDDRQDYRERLRRK